MNVLVIIPAYNEENSIARVVRAVHEAHPEVDMLVVNDGSTDETSLRARATGLAHVIDLPFNVGIGGAVQTGYIFASRHGYDIAIQLDADGQHEPGDLNKIVSVISNGEADCCIGSRFLEKTGYTSTPIRQWGIRFFSWLIRALTGRTMTDPTSGFRAVNRKAMEYFAENYPDDYPEVEALVMLERKGFTIKETPVHMHCREEGHSSITAGKALYYMTKVSLAVLLTRFRNVG
ncbi:glycosyltransferase family 2 protein [Paenibacillus senegalensis]|uniref:glycosyltransferase family 2 protein n=1 Tax=Paenibacillus senegalensis TaxID=1465766 RepID=UPI000289C0AC